METKKYKGFKYTGFISYRRIGWCNEFAGFIYNILKKHEADYGGEIFYDKNDIEIADDIPGEITDGIWDSMVFLFLVVPVSIIKANPYCAWELAHFYEYEKERIKKIKEENPDKDEKKYKQIIPVIIRGKVEDLPPILRDRHYIDLSSVLLRITIDDEVVYDALKKIINKINSLRHLFEDFENIKKIPPPAKDFNILMEKLGYTEPPLPPFPTM